MEESKFMIQEPKAYIGGHITLWLVSVIQTVVPITLWYVWRKPEIGAPSINLWFSNSWKAMWIGSVSANGLQALLWPLTFTSSRTMHLIYIGLWTILGLVPNVMVFLTVVIYLLVATNRYEDHPDVNEEELYYTLLAYIPTEFILGVLVKEYLWDSFMYMRSEEVQSWCDKHFDVCDDYKVLKKAPEPEADSIPEFYSIPFDF